MSETAERYARAASSANLRATEAPGDVDVLIAAGAATNAGTVLLRCRNEWDAQRAEVERQEDDPALSRAAILQGMGSLPFASAHLYRLAADRVSRRALQLSPEIIARCVGNALDIWLDQRCDACCGRGFNGGNGAPKMMCRTCRTGGRRRRVLPAKTPHEHQLGEWLIVRAETLVAQAQAEIGGALR